MAFLRTGGVGLRGLKGSCWRRGRGVWWMENRVCLEVGVRTILGYEVRCTRLISELWLQLHTWVILRR